MARSVTSCQPSLHPLLPMIFCTLGSWRHFKTLRFSSFKLPKMKMMKLKQRHLDMRYALRIAIFSFLHLIEVVKKNISDTLDLLPCFILPTYLQNTIQSIQDARLHQIPISWHEISYHMEEASDAHIQPQNTQVIPLVNNSHPEIDI